MPSFKTIGNLLLEDIKQAGTGASLFMLAPFWIYWHIQSCFLLLLLALVFSFFERIRNKDAILQFNALEKGIMAMYLLWMPALLWSQHIDVALMDWQVKSGLLLFPFGLALIRPSAKTMRYFTLFLALGLLSKLLQLFAIACKDFLQDFAYFHFFYSSLSPQHHTTYMAVYVVAAMLLVSIAADKVKPQTTFLLIILVFFLVLLSSRMALLSFLAILPLLIKLNHKAKRRQWCIVAMVLCLFLLLQSLLINRFTQVKEAINSPISSEKVVINSSTARLVIWKSAITQIVNNPKALLIGYGSGDVHDALNQAYVKVGFEEGIEKNLNAHNQFINLLYSHGLLGALGLIVWLGFAMHTMWRRRRFTSFLFGLVLSLNFLTESMLEGQYGVLLMGLIWPVIFRWEMAETKPLANKARILPLEN